MADQLFTSQAFDEILSFIPKLYSPDGAPIKTTVGKASAYPVYTETVQQFYAVASKWIDTDYDPTASRKFLTAPGVIDSADLGEVRAMLTLCVRSERFSDGQWGALIENGDILKLLLRLKALRPVA